MNEDIDGGEIVIGFVGPIGTDLDKVLKAAASQLTKYEYTVIIHRLSKFFEFEQVKPIIPAIDTLNEYTRIKGSMEAGDQLRKATRIDSIMALFAAAQIRGSRDFDGKPMRRTAHLLRSLKRPEEAEQLRHTYGSRFMLVSVFSSREDRLLYLHHEKQLTPPQAAELVERDGAGGHHGQATIKTFELADFFLDGSRNLPQLEVEFSRFFDLIFGSPLVTPTAQEHGMFAAFATSLRSGDLSRQVGAVIATSGGTIVSEGVNDSPRFGGEGHWPGDEDRRDIAVGDDSNEKIKRKIVEAILREFDALEVGVDPLKIAKQRLGGSGLLDITEFGRAVHAEMAALMNCARLGIPTAGHTLYCTTFPCHNCAKHIVAAGITRVYFIEPYPKSRALELHSDSLSLGPSSERLVFHPFVGIGPRRYVELFSLRDAFGRKISRKDDQGQIIEWSAKDASTVLPDRLVNYLEIEEWAAAELARVVEDQGTLR